MSDIPTTEPEKIIAGDTLQWNREDLSSDYPASTWTLTYYLVKSGTRITIIASASGEYFSVSETAATSASYATGKYKWDAYVSKGAERYRVDYGHTEIFPDYAQQATGYDDRSHAKTMLDLIEAALESKATDEELNVISKTLEGYGLDMNDKNLLEYRITYKTEYQAELRKERLANGQGSGLKVSPRF